MKVRDVSSYLIGLKLRVHPGFGKNRVDLQKAELRSGFPKYFRGGGLVNIIGTY